MTDLLPGAEATRSDRAIATYSYFAVEFLTGEILTELPLTTVEFARRLSGAGHFRATLPARDPRLWQLDIMNVTEPNATGVWINRSGVTVGGYLLTSRDYSAEDGAFTLSGIESWGYFDRRFIEPTRTFAQADQGHIVHDLLDRAQREFPGGNVRLQLPERASMTTGRLRDRTYLAGDLKPISEAIEQMSEVIDGFEFYCAPFWENERAAWRLVFGYPRLGLRRERSQLVWDYPGGILNYRWPEDGTNQANEMAAVGAEDDGNPRVERAKGIRGRWPLLQGSQSHRDVSDAATLRGHAEADLQRFRTPYVKPSVTVAGDLNPVLGSYHLGDDVMLAFDDPNFEARRAQWWRLMGWTVYPPNLATGSDEKVTLELRQ